jgi:hypothetical protein
MAIRDESVGNPGDDENSKRSADKAGDGQSIVPDEDANKYSRPRKDGKFARLKKRWNKYLVFDWEDASEETRARFVSDVMGYPERVQ